MVTAAALDEAKVSAFEERFVGVLNAGALCLMTSIGHRTGLFDVMAESAAGDECPDRGERGPESSATSANGSAPC